MGDHYPSDGDEYHIKVAQQYSTEIERWGARVTIERDGADVGAGLAFTSKAWMPPSEVLRRILASAEVQEGGANAKGCELDQPLSQALGRQYGDAAEAIEVCKARGWALLMIRSPDPAAHPHRLRAVRKAREVVGLPPCHLLQPHRDPRVNHEVAARVAKHFA